MEEKKKCKFCQTEIDKKAKICPNCRKKQGNKLPIIIAVIVAIIIIVGISGENDNTNNNTNTNDSTSANSNSVVVEKKTSYEVGETFSNRFINLTFVEKDDNFTNYSQWATVKDGYKIIRAKFEMENIDKSDQTIMYTDFNCYADGYSCDSFYSVDDSGFSATLSTGKKTSGNVYFEVPVNANKITIEYDVNFWTNENIEFIIK